MDELFIPKYLHSNKINNQSYNIFMVKMKQFVEYYNNNKTTKLIKKYYHGDIKYLPKMLQTTEIRGYNTLSGNISDMPTGNTPNNFTQYFNISGFNTISGDVSTMSVNLRDVFLAGYNTVSGNTSGFPRNICVLSVGGNNTVTGDIKYLPSGITKLDLAGLNTIKTYTVGRVWAPKLEQIEVVSYPQSVNYLSTTDVDNLMISLTATTWQYSTRFPGGKYATFVGTASTVSQAARNKLTGTTSGGYGVVLTLL
jgi:hypothetical protein